MKTVKEFPPNIKDIGKVIDLSKCPRAIFTYGHVIYNPAGGAIDEPLGFHEAMHSLQQDEVGGPAEWWEAWLKNPKFRGEQELQAYGVQYRRYCELNADRNKRAVFLMNIANDLSSAQYGKVMSYTDARRLLATFCKD